METAPFGAVKPGNGGSREIVVRNAAMETAPFGAVKHRSTTSPPTTLSSRNGDRSFRSGEVAALGTEFTTAAPAAMETAPFGAVKRQAKVRHAGELVEGAAMETAPFGAVKRATTTGIAYSPARARQAAMETAPFGAVKPDRSNQRQRQGTEPQWRPLLSER